MEEKKSFVEQSRRQFFSKVLSTGSLIYLGALSLPSYAGVENKEKSHMDYSEILEFLAPCGLNCNKCFAYIKGGIGFHSKELKKWLGSFEKYSEGASTVWPEFKNYTQFYTLLNFLTGPECKGCRQGDCKHPDCGVIKCYKKKGVDFCFQCDEFPCDKSKFDSGLKERWLKANNRMKEIGVVAFYEETKDSSRYY